MKRYTYLLPLSVVIVVTLFSFQRVGKFEIEDYLIKNIHIKNAGGASAGMTGGIGEANCTSCHTGTALDGSTENFLTVMNGFNSVTSYVPGTTYTVVLTMNSMPAKKGFQSTVLDASGNMAGNFTAGTNTSISGTARKYSNHTATSNTSSTTAWIWNWTAPASDMGDVTFYVASNKANGDLSDTGDEIYLSQHVITSTLGLSEKSKDDTFFNAAYNPSGNALKIEFNTLTAGNMHLNVVELSGRSVFVQDLGNAVIGKNSESVVLPGDLKDGQYVAHFFIGNKAMSAKFMIAH